MKSGRKMLEWAKGVRFRRRTRDWTGDWRAALGYDRPVWNQCVWWPAVVVLMTVLSAGMFFSSCERKPAEPLGQIPVPPGERTSFQVAPAWRPTLDLQADVAMVYMGTDTTGYRPRFVSWQAQGYRTYTMLAVGRGDRDHFVRGDWYRVDGNHDGHRHWGDIQVDRQGERLAHSSRGDVFYMVPTPAFTEFLRVNVRAAVDAGAEGVCLEEPEFWARAGYSPAFKKAWEEVYGRPWQDPASSPQTWLDAARLKQKLYLKIVRVLFEDIRDYVKDHGGQVRRIVATHSPLNYAHWGIVSPETQYLRLSTCDGVVAQVWTGTARTPVTYRGLRRERVFDLAFLEYSSVKNMVVGTGRSLWFLADPVEDDPGHDWGDYRRNYQETLVAALLHPEVRGYEIMPWPDRVLEREYARQALKLTAEEFLRILAKARKEIADVRKTVPADSVASWRRYLALYPDSVAAVIRRAGSPNLEGEIYRYRNRKLAGLPGGAKQPIPREYATELLVVADALRRMEAVPPEAVHWQSGPSGVGVVFSDAAMLERGSPWSPQMESFYGLALPLLDAGVPVQVAMLERFADPGYLSRFKCLVLSFEAFKPFEKDAVTALVQWVREGGALLLYVTPPDPFDNADSWWRREGASTPARALLTELDLKPTVEPQQVGKGWVSVREMSPAALSRRADGGELVLKHVSLLCQQVAGCKIDRKGYLALRRGVYLIAASPHDALLRTPKVWHGGFLDLLDGRVPVREKLVLTPGKVVFALDVSRVGSRPQILVSASRVKDFSVGHSGVRFLSRGPQGVLCKTVLRLPTNYRSASARLVSTAQPIDIVLYRDESRALTYLTYENQGEWVEVSLRRK